MLPPLSPVPRADPTNPSDATFEPLRELAASHAVLAVALVGVILLQSGQYYSETLEERERIEEVEARLRRRQRKARLEQERVASAAASGVASGTTAAGSGSGSNAVPAA